MQEKRVPAPASAGLLPGARASRARRFLEYLYKDALFLALIPPVALTFDYSLTFRLAGSHDTVLSFEASPVVRFVLGHNLMVAYFISLLALYFLASLAMLRWLKKTRYYPSGVAAVLIIGLAHFLGGLSWVARSSLYTMAVSILTTTLFLLTALAMGRELLSERKNPEQGIRCPEGRT